MSAIVGWLTAYTRAPAQRLWENESTLKREIS
jgi:hypothetical protein